jgi:anti-sigma regulatory factor (Ser/Thr protein kinase)/anti-anti-sigma regulatory factor
VVDIGGDLDAAIARLDDHILVRLIGPLTLASVPGTETLIIKLLAEGRPVLVDVSRLDMVWTAALEVFPTALAAGGGWPTGRLVLFGAAPQVGDVLHALRIDQRMPVEENYEAAWVARDERPQQLRRGWELPMRLSSAGTARTGVREACADWGIPAAQATLELIVTELVTNAVQHARSAPLATLGLHGDEATVFVEDVLPGERPRPQLTSTDAPECGGKGLLLVAALAKSWGVIDRVCGKAVWATVSVIDPPL